MCVCAERVSYMFVCALTCGLIECVFVCDCSLMVCVKTCLFVWMCACVCLQECVYGCAFVVCALWCVCVCICMCESVNGCILNQLFENFALFYCIELKNNIKIVY